MFTRVIWASDGSDSADVALPYAKALTVALGGELVAVHAVKVAYGRGGVYPAFADEEDLAAKVEAQVDEARSEGLVARFEVVSHLSASPAEMIARAARALEADVIVVGTRGHGPIAGALRGSVTHALLHVAACPVLVVPEGESVATLAEPVPQRAAS